MSVDIESRTGSLATSLLVPWLKHMLPSPQSLSFLGQVSDQFKGGSLRDPTHPRRPERTSPGESHPRLLIDTFGKYARGDHNPAYGIPCLPAEALSGYGLIVVKKACPHFAGLLHSSPSGA